MGKNVWKMGKQILALLMVLIMSVISIQMPVRAATPDGAGVEDTEITDLKTNDLTTPVGIDTESPTFSWKMKSAVIGQCQKAYQITVATDNSFTDIVWDSQKKTEDKSVGIKYEGEVLKASTTYYWKLAVWDKNETKIQSDTSKFETGLMGNDGWDKSQWIQVGTSAEAPTSTTGVTDYVVEADIQITETSVSMLLEATDKQNYLLWQFNNKNGYMEFKPHYVKGGNFTAIRQLNVSQYVQGADTDVQHMKVAVTKESISTYLNGHLIEQIPASALGGVGLNGTIGRLGFRSHSLEKEAGWLDHIVLTDYSVDIQGIVLKNYDFEDGVNPFDDGAVENGRLNTKYTGFETIALEKVESMTDKVHYTVEADITCTTDAVSLLFNATDSSNFYMLHLNTKDQVGKILYKPHTWKNGNYATYSSHNKDVTNVLGSVENFKVSPVHVKIDVTEAEMKTYLNDQLIDTFTIGETSNQGTTGIRPQIASLGFRADLQENGTVDNYKLVDYSEIVDSVKFDMKN